LERLSLIRVDKLSKILLAGFEPITALAFHGGSAYLEDDSFLGNEGPKAH
jgi:hypothetical protein